MNKMREQFEKWASCKGLNLSTYCKPDVEYVNEYTHIAWMAWRASREILVINIPITQFDDGCGDTYEGVCLEDMQQAIEEQGVKCK